MKKIFQACLLVCAVFSANSFAEQSYACQAMLERGSAMFCQDGSQNIASVPASKPGVEIALTSKDRSYACNSMMARDSEMFCNKEGGLPGRVIASE